MLSHNSRNLVETIEAVSRDPETLAALQVFFSKCCFSPHSPYVVLCGINCSRSTPLPLPDLRQGLLLQLLQTASTRAALLELLLAVFEDEALCRTTGLFLLRSLDTADAKAQLQSQLAALVAATVHDEQVSRAASPSVASLGRLVQCVFLSRAVATAGRFTSSRNPSHFPFHPCVRSAGAAGRIIGGKPDRTAGRRLRPDTQLAQKQLRRRRCQSCCRRRHRRHR
jgi:hypothetical protein